MKSVSTYVSGCCSAKTKAIPFAPGFRCGKCGKDCIGVPVTMTVEEYRNRK